MITNSFSKKMSSKSDQELLSIFEQKDHYNDEAIEAVVLELDARNLIEKTEVSKHTRSFDENQKEIVKADSSAKNDDPNKSPFDDLVQPELYSKNAILGFTIFFSTIFGTFLLMYNLKVMNKLKARTQVLFFGIGYTIFSVFLANFLPKVFYISLLFNIVGYLILTEYFWNSLIGKDFKHQKKGISNPLIISLIITALLFFVIVLPAVKSV